MVGGNDKTHEKSIVFNTPEQIAEILAEANRLKLQVLIKYTNDGKAVRGFIERTDLMQEKGIRINGISAAGDAMLANFQVVQIEFVLLSKKIYFIAKIRARAATKLLLSVPEKVFALERRLNSRFKVPVSLSAFMEFEGKSVNLSRFDAPLPLVPNSYSPTSTVKFLIDDISLGGAAVFTRYSSVAETLKSNSTQLNATIMFPKTMTMMAPISIRWNKKSTVHVLPGKHDQIRQLFSNHLSQVGVRNFEVDFNEVYYRIGIQFSEVSKELDHNLRTYIHNIQTFESI